MPLEIPPSTFAFRIMRKLQELYGKDPGGTEMELSAYPDPRCPDSEIVPAPTTLIEEERGTMSTVTIAITDYEDWRTKLRSALARLVAARMFLYAHDDEDAGANVKLLEVDVEMLMEMLQGSIDSIESIMPMRPLSTDGDAQRDTLQSQLDSQIASYRHLLGSNAQAVKDLVRLEGRVKELEGELAAKSKLGGEALARAATVICSLSQLKDRAEELASDIGELLEPESAPVGRLGEGRDLFGRGVTGSPLLGLGLEDPAEEQSVAAFINQTIAENCMG
jgi:hypothetical protein